jgi:hypothetical protein
MKKPGKIMVLVGRIETPEQPKTIGKLAERPLTVQNGRFGQWEKTTVLVGLSQITEVSCPDPGHCPAQNSGFEQ